MVKTVKSIKKKNRFVFDTLLKINRFVKWLMHCRIITYKKPDGKYGYYTERM